MQHRDDSLRRGGEAAIPEMRQHGFGRVGQGEQARHAKEAASALDRMKDAENAVEQRNVAWIPLERLQLRVEAVKAFGGVGDELGDQVIHCGPCLCCASEHRSTKSG